MNSDHVTGTGSGTCIDVAGTSTNVGTTCTDEGGMGTDKVVQLLVLVIHAQMQMVPVPTKWYRHQ